MSEEDPSRINLEEGMPPVNNIEAARALHNMAVAELEEGNYTAAIRHIKRAIHYLEAEYAEQAIHKMEYARCQRLLGCSYLELEDYLASEEALKTALLAYQNAYGVNHEATGYAHLYLVYLYSDTGNRQMANTHAESTRAIFKGTEEEAEIEKELVGVNC